LRANATKAGFVAADMRPTMTRRLRNCGGAPKYQNGSSASGKAGFWPRSVFRNEGGKKKKLMTTPGNDTIRVYLRDCTVSLYVGVYGHERPKPQPVVVHIEATASLARRYDDLRARDIASIIDYGPWYDFIVKTLPTLGHIPLLESVAERIISFCFEDPRIETVRVRLEKPEAFAGEAIPGIEMTRRRRAT
jgi:dihydroneopterin aldolase